MSADVIERGVTPPGGPSRPLWWRRVSLLRDYSVLLVTVGLFVTLAITSDSFLTKTNLLNIVDQQTSLGIIACAGTLVIIAGGFDSRSERCTRLAACSRRSWPITWAWPKESSSALSPAACWGS